MLTEIDELKSRLDRAEQEARDARRRSRLSAACALGALSLTALLNIRPVAQAQSPGVSLPSLLSRVSALEQKTSPLTINGTDLTVTGVNVHIVNGLGSTSTVNGTGNLIIGYGGGGKTGGSHNLVLGEYNNYESYGGLVGGYGNDIQAEDASVVDGFDNHASGQLTAVLGGQANVAGDTAHPNDAALGFGATVVGGQYNTAAGYIAAVVGGSNNTAYGTFSSVTGGQGNTAGSAGTPGTRSNPATPGQGAVVFGGRSTAASTDFALEPLASNLSAVTSRIGTLETKTASLSVSADPVVGGTNTLLTFKGVNIRLVNGMGATETKNGLGNLIVGYNEARGSDQNGAPQDVRTGSHNIVTGIRNNYFSFGGLIGGYGNSLNAIEGCVFGALNTASGHQAVVSGGINNSVTGDYAVVSGGHANTASGQYAVVSGGSLNSATGLFAVVSGGFNNTASGQYTAISGGNTNAATGDFSAVSGGYLGTANGFASVIGGGRYASNDGHQYGWVANFSGNGNDSIHGNLFEP